MEATRRQLLAAASAASAAGLAGCVTRPLSETRFGEVYRVTDEAMILSVAKAVIDEDFIATLITIDGRGVPRARSVGVWAPDGDFNLWIGTRRTSRKLDQIRANPNATLHFARDDIEGGFKGAYYASFMGRAEVHTDPATLELRAPAEEYRRNEWPNFPDDYAAISFRTEWLEVYGRGISGKPDNWQPQAVVL